MNSDQQVPLRNYIPLAAVGFIGLVIGVFVPVLKLIFPSTIFLAGSLGISHVWCSLSMVC